MNKKKRQENIKTEKFNIETINKNTVNKINNHFYKNLFTENFSKKIFSDNFKETINALNDIKNYLKDNQNLNAFFDNVDIILRILCLKIYDNQNSSLAKNFFEFLQILLNSSKNFKYSFTEFESNIIISILLDKFSIIHSLKENLNELIKEFVENNHPNLTTLTMLNFSLLKDSKIKENVLEIVKDLYVNQKIDIININYIKTLSKFVSFNDVKIKAKALTILKQILTNLEMISGISLI